MMLLSAVILIIAFVALSAMVARVSQLGKLTSRERASPTINGVEPMLQGANAAIQSLTAQYSRSEVVTTGTSTTVFTDDGRKGDAGTMWVGSYVMLTTGANAGKLRTVSTFTNGTTGTFTVSTALTAAPVAGDQFRLVRPAQAQNLQDSIQAALKQMVTLQMSQGYLMGYKIVCTAQTNEGQVLLTLDDGAVQAVVRTVTFPRPAADACSTLTG